MTKRTTSALAVLAAFSSIVLACSASDSASEDGDESTQALDATKSVNGALIPTVTDIVDGAGTTWTVSGGVIFANGAKAGYSANVIDLLLFGGTIYQENTAKGWWKWTGTTWAGSSDPRATSANDTSATGSQVIVDAAHDVWALSGAVIYENGAKGGYSANVAELYYASGKIYHENTSKNWYVWNGSSWAATSNPTGAAPTPPPTTPPPAPTSPPSTTGIWVYRDGAFNWPLSNDYSYALTDNYKDTSGEPLTGAYDIKATASPFGGWQPSAGVPLTPTNWDQNITGMKYFTFALKPTAAGQTWKLFFHKVGDVYVYDASGEAETVSVNTASYGPVSPAVNEWSTYKVPLTDVLTDYSVGGVPGKGPPTLLTHVYKFAIADATGENRTWYIDNVGFTP